MIGVGLLDLDRLTQGRGLRDGVAIGTILKMLAISEGLLLGIKNPHLAK